MEEGRAQEQVRDVSLPQTMEELMERMRYKPDQRILPAE